MTLLRLDGVHAGYERVAVVRDLTLEVGAGEVVALLGPNGAGKTTTLLTISGLLAPIVGTVEVLGRHITPGRRSRTTRAAWQLARLGLAHVPEDRGLFFGLTAAENLRLGARTRAQRATAVAQAVERFPALERLLERKAGLLSGGEQQMLAVARALAAEPKVLLVDEMSLGLAPLIVEALLPEMARIARDEGLGVVLVEQHVSAALAVADRAIVLVHGEVTMSGTADELLGRRDLLESTYLGDHGPS